MDKKNKKQKKINTNLKRICLLVSMLIFLVLCGCGYQKEPTICDIPTLGVKATEITEPSDGTTENNNDKNNSEGDVEEIEKDLNPYDFVLTFVGDINLDENWSTMKYYNTVANGINDCISPELIQIMRDANIMCINNEFTYSTRGVPLSNKAYTFRAHPSRVNILKELGVDIVSLANNHAYDYGEQSLIDTMATLKQADILYYGAGHNLDEAIKPVYFQIEGMTIAYVAASRAEKNKMTPQATADSTGILQCYDTELFIETIKEAKENSDYVIAYVHWGTEFTSKLEKAQLTTGKEYLDAGADIVIGAHPHCLQGIEYFNGKPIIYSLGNFWFNNETADTMLLNIHFYEDNTEKFIELEIVPANQANNTTTIVTEQLEKERIYSFLEDISINVEINDAGIISEVK